ncbi:MAG: aldehyde dehydrogenase family protein [Polyangiaceae bacterium]
MEPETSPPRHEAREDKPSDIDRAAAGAAAVASDFARLAPQKKAELLDRVAEGLNRVSADIVALGCEAKGIPRGSRAEAEEWFAGPSVAVGLARHHAAALREIDRGGRPSLSRWRISRTRDGRTVTRLVPRFTGGGLIETGMSFAVLHTRGTTPADIARGQAELARASEPGTTAVLGAGNVASIPIADVLHSLFVENRTAVLKMNPVNAYLRAPFEAAFAPLLAQGYVQIVDGGAAAGAHLVESRDITHVHLTGSADTHDRIVWGPPGAEREDRKSRGEPLLKKPVTSELGNISPAIVPPYLYSTGEIRAIAENLATQLTNNASFNCNAGKMLVLPRGFPQRKLLLDTLVKVLEGVPLRRAYYPGAKDRHTALTSGRQGVFHIGAPADGQLPWSIVTEVDASNDGEPLFSTEPFCSMLSVVELGSLDPMEFLPEAVRFCNERLWGTLSACLFAPSLYEEDNRVEHEIERAVQGLEYGAVGVNVWPAVVYATPRAPWGGHPKGTLADVQSGIGFVHNPLLLPAIEKTIVRGPLVPLPKPPFIVGHKHALPAARKLTAYSDAPGLGAALSVVKTTLLGD